GDVSSAKAEAFSRAKWTAIEQVVGVQVRAESIVQNFALLDDAVVKQIAGVVRSASIVSESRQGDVYVVTANVCVEPTLASRAVEQLALNNALSVLVFSKLGRAEVYEHRYRQTETGTRSEHVYQRTTPIKEAVKFTETLLGVLTEREYKVYDTSDVFQPEEVDIILIKGDYARMRNQMYKNLSNLAMLGVIEYNYQAAPGQDIGHGVRMPFHVINATLSYRIVAREVATGKMVIVSSGTERTTARALTQEEALTQAEINIAKQVAPKIVETISRYIRGLAKPVKLVFEDVKDIGETLSIKSSLQNLAWVTDVRDQGAGEFVVGYPENPIYLAMALEQRGYKVVRYSPTEIKLRRR
ncbi:MAG: hypothetical protein NZ526_06170, partial [Aquificaceae bacterium]|nr:hypothetical protein [Aquificaceae bacterium]